MVYTKEELEQILEKDFLLNPRAFSPGRTNNDVVDSMIICFILDREWTELFAKWVDNYEEQHGEYWYINHWKGIEKQIGGIIIGNCYQCPEKENEIKRILEHYERVKNWIEKREEYSIEARENGYNELYPFEHGNLDLMEYSINY